MIDPVLADVPSSTNLPDGQFYALYMGSSLVTDAQEKNALKMAARTLLEEEEQCFQSPCEVDIHLLPSGIKVMARQNSKPSSAMSSDSKVILYTPYRLVSACFIMREDSKMISLGVTDPKIVTHAHVFLFTTNQIAERMVSLLQILCE